MEVQRELGRTSRLRLPPGLTGSNPLHLHGIPVESLTDSRAGRAEIGFKTLGGGTVESKPAFNVFIRDRKGQKWRGVFASPVVAMKKAQELSDLGNVECVVCDAKARREIAKYIPELSQINRKPRQNDSI